MKGARFNYRYCYAAPFVLFAMLASSVMGYLLAQL